MSTSFRVAHQKRHKALGMWLCFKVAGYTKLGLWLHRAFCSQNALVVCCLDINLLRRVCLCLSSDINEQECGESPIANSI